MSQGGYDEDAQGIKYAEVHKRAKRLFPKLPDNVEVHTSIRTDTGIETVRSVTSTDIFKTQVGGDHYTRMGIQPIEYALANNMTFIEANVVKYVSRWRFKGGVQDLKKAQHMLGLLIAHEEGKAKDVAPMKADISEFKLKPEQLVTVR